MNSLLIGLLIGGFAQIIAFVQFQAQFKWEWANQHQFVMACLGIPVSLLHIISIKYVVDYYNGELWPSRILAFAVSSIVFAAMAYFWFKESFNLKTSICTILAFCILLIQVYWK